MLARSEWPKDYMEQFWDFYPRRVAKKTALKALEKVKRSNEVPFEVLLSAVKMYARATAGKDRQFVAHPATWINGGRWDDEDLQPKAVVSSTGLVRISQDTPQWEAWRVFRGKPFPVDKDGGWWVSSEWPGGING